MKRLRIYLCWIFAISSLICFQIVFSSILRIIQQAYRSLSFRNLLVPEVFSVQAIVFGVAWFTVWRAKASGKWWGIAASLMNLLFPIALSIYLRHPIWRYQMLTMGIGVAGLVAFLWPAGQADSTVRTNENPPIPGDGTSEFFNRISELLVFASGLVAVFWWIRWVRANRVPRSHGELSEFALFILALLVITTLHEVGHTATGLALGMKLRAFFAGPFQWRIREGRWEFQFKPGALLSLEGATGVVPASADFPRWSYICMIAAGPLFTLLTGISALCPHGSRT